MDAVEASQLARRTEAGMDDEDEEYIELINFDRKADFSEQGGIFYTPKCSSASHCLRSGDTITRLQTINCIPLTHDEDDDQEVKPLRLPLPQTSRYAPMSGSGCDNHDLRPPTSYSRSHEARPELRESREILIRLCGGEIEAHRIYHTCADLVNRRPEYLSQVKPSGDTILSQLCFRVFDQKSSANGTDEHEKFQAQQRLLIGQVYAFIRIFLERNREDLLFVRNRQFNNALELAGLTNKVEISVYLTRLYIAFDRDSNESGKDGHTVLHLMARKGDDCADALEAILAIKSDENRRKRVLRMDVVNSGRKTPLDVAVACASYFSTGANRIVFERVIGTFHDVIQTDADEMIGEEGNTRTFRNF